MKALLLNIGFGNVVVADRIVAIVSPGSAPIKRLKEDAKEQGRLIDATYGRKNPRHRCHRIESCDSFGDQP